MANQTDYEDEFYFKVHRQISFGRKIFPVVIVLVFIVRVLVGLFVGSV